MGDWTITLYFDGVYGYAISHMVTPDQQTQGIPVTVGYGSTFFDLKKRIVLLFKEHGLCDYNIRDICVGNAENQSIVGWGDYPKPMQANVTLKRTSRIYVFLQGFWQ